jgi:hypothetical protein
MAGTGWTDKTSVLVPDFQPRKTQNAKRKTQNAKRKAGDALQEERGGSIGGVADTFWTEELGVPPYLCGCC